MNTLLESPALSDLPTKDALLTFASGTSGTVKEWAERVGKSESAVRHALNDLSYAYGEVAMFELTDGWGTTNNPCVFTRL